MLNYSFKAAIQNHSSINSLAPVHWHVGVLTLVCYGQSGGLWTTAERLSHCVCMCVYVCVCVCVPQMQQLLAWVAITRDLDLGDTDWGQHPAFHMSVCVCLCVCLCVFGEYHRHPVCVFYVDSVKCMQQGDKKNTIPEPGIDSFPTFPGGHKESVLT